MIPPPIEVRPEAGGGHGGGAWGSDQQLVVLDDHHETRTDLNQTRGRKNMIHAQNEAQEKVVLDEPLEKVVSGEPNLKP